MSTNTNKITIENLVIKYLDCNRFNNYDSHSFKRIFNINKLPGLHVCVQLTNKYPELNDFLEDYFKTCSDINQIDRNGWSALHHAVCYSNFTSTERTVEILINNGADINLQGQYYRTPLHLAVIHYTQSTKRTIELLILANADVFNLKDNCDKAPIDYFTQELLELFEIDKDTQTIGIKSGRTTKQAKK